MEDDIRIIGEVAEELEQHFNEVMREVLEEHHAGIAVNIMINLSTSILAKALIMTPDSARESVVNIVAKIVDSKLKEGEAAVESIIAISKASGSDTCAPWPPKKH